MLGPCKHSSCRVPCGALGWQSWAGRAGPLVPLLGEIRDEFPLPELLQCWPPPSRRNPSCSFPPCELRGCSGAAPSPGALALSEGDMHGQTNPRSPSAEPLPWFCWLKAAQEGFRPPEGSPAGPRRKYDKYDSAVKCYWLGSVSQEFWCDGQRRANISFSLSF